MPDPIMPPSPIPIEETPEIPMETPHRGSPMITIGILIILFAAGYFLSRYLKPFFSSVSIVPTSIPLAATPTPTDPFARWKIYTLSGVSYSLPSDVLVPTCDGISCVSRGTYLPGGTRFTVASRGSSAFVTDANGVAFVNHVATISGQVATEFSGTFSGRTITGYAFTQMHGFMIVLTPTATLEINHFTPAGITADFDKDEELFTHIVSTLDFSSPSATMK